MEAPLSRPRWGLVVVVVVVVVAIRGEPRTMPERNKVIGSRRGRHLTLPSTLPRRLNQSLRLVDSDCVLGLVHGFFQVSSDPNPGDRKTEIEDKWLLSNWSSSSKAGWTPKRKLNSSLHPPGTTSTPQVGRIVDAVLLTSPLFQTSTLVQDGRRRGPGLGQHVLVDSVQVGRLSGSFRIYHASFAKGSGPAEDFRGSLEPSPSSGWSNWGCSFH